MVGNIPDAIEKEDVIVVEVPAEETDKRQDKKTALEHPEPRPCLLYTSHDLGQSSQIIFLLHDKLIFNVGKFGN